MSVKHVEIITDKFGDIVHHRTKNIESVIRYTIKTKTLVVQVISFGATISSIQMPDKHGNFDDIVLGFDDVAGYESEINPYFGAVVGRYANRISNGTFKLQGETYQLAKNAGGINHLHGGIIGFNKVNWNSYVDNDRVIFTYLSVDCEEGYPGDLLTSVIYEIACDNKLVVTFDAVCTKPTIINLTNHSYFNLAGHGSGSKGVYNHEISINADKITVLDKNLTATGELKHVGGTSYDLRIATNLGKGLQNLSENGYDFNYCLNKPCSDDKIITFAARVVEPQTGRYLEVHTNQPGIQFYTGNSIPNGKGKNGIHFGKQSAFCLETQNFPNSVNISSFPNSVLTPGDKYEHIVSYTFGIMEETS